jgi:tetratricopeptide (TPR) repeat protein
MSLELNLVFPDPQHVIIQSRTGSTQPSDFVNPLTADDLKDIRWYLEVYSSQYMTDVDDDRARDIEDSLSRWGSALFTAALGQFVAQAAFMQFYNSKQAGRVLTIGASHPDILSLPWELLHIPGGGFLFNSNPRISIRRQFNVAGGFNLTEYQPKERVRILFIVSRPRDAGFIDPRSDTQAVLAALKQEGRGRVEIEFLRPATIDALRQRLDDRESPAIDIVHFDGHGLYDQTANVGYLLFEDERRRRALISAEKLAGLLHEKAVGLVVLSACQSAMVAISSESGNSNSTDETQDDSPISDAMGSVAARLTHAGIPAVLAMTYSVLVDTTRALFGEFYQNLLMGYGMGEALDNARENLYLNQERGNRQRGQEHITLKLQDWFLPALYQASTDTPLLLNAPEQAPTEASNEAGFSDGFESFGNLPTLQEAGFFGRSRELWEIERAFVRGTGRISLVGFGGQGKTFLAQEAGRWLCQTGMFARVCFVDYASFQGVDAVGLAVSTLGTVLNQSFVDEQAATVALGQNATLLILDNLEALSAESLRALLDVALVWSQVERCRVLLTSRQPDFEHDGYKTAGSFDHIRLILGGLGSEAYPVDALNYFQALMKLPPEPTVPAPSREALVNLFKLVDFHPLSVGWLALHLKDRRPAELGERLNDLLAEADKDKSPVASLKLSLDRVGPELRKWLPRLSVFQGGVFEDSLLIITGVTPTEEQAFRRHLKQLFEKLQRGETISETESGLPQGQWQDLLNLVQVHPEALEEFLSQLTDVVDTIECINAEDWPQIRKMLVRSGIIQLEKVSDVDIPYLKFHPTLAPVLWSQLTNSEQVALRIQYKKQYYQLSLHLYKEDCQNPEAIRGIAQRELPNLLLAVKFALEDEDINAADFANNISMFLNYFGLAQDQQMLATKLSKMGEKDSAQQWYLIQNSEGNKSYKSGHYEQAEQVFLEIFNKLEDEPSYKQCAMLLMLGRCSIRQGQVTLAAERLQKGIDTSRKLEESNAVKQQRGVLYCDLADALKEMEDYSKSEENYEASLILAIDQNDRRQIGVIKGQLGSLAMSKGELSKAFKLHTESLKVFQKLKEPKEEAVGWHQLGRICEEAQQWDEADRYYRESLQVKESEGDLAGAARTYNQLAIINQKAGREQDAITLYKKAIAGGKSAQDWLPTARALSNLANLLQSQQNAADKSTQLDTARQYAEAALSIDRDLDPAAATIWKTYGLLAIIAEKQGQVATARGYRQQARQAKAAFAGTHELRQHRQLIVEVVSVATGDEEVKVRLLSQMNEAQQGRASNLIYAIRRILEGERDEETLVDPLYADDSMIVMAILQGIADPSSLERFAAEEQP